MTHKFLVIVLEAWTHDDDWSMASIYMTTIHDLNDALNAGDNAVVLLNHARHVKSDCDKAGCALAIPYFMSIYR